ncbi:drug/metabolite transporter (DMT)-like permease [Desulfobaculum xiamenense]|uniref:Drug/metabolite transporter (DMT)-like permease n=1 Tax=Desulfobaculum xiamenense TaxID=995050 RepID=A0A846QHA3_9BACT|nr:DMT family transporter [Desulfobaculum xiamenense]NJB66500.1 drug/metabolite transporter (DMT)-like permease [Desulfobaculum xiamenense]
MMTTSATIAQLKERHDLAFAKKGLAWALGSGMIWGLEGVVLGMALALAPFADSPLWLLAPLTASCMHDCTAALWTLAYNWRTGRLREVGRSIFSKPGRFVCLGALCGGPIGMGGYLVALKLAGPAYVMPITSLYPAVASVLAMIFLKERISRRAWLGLGLCIAGAFIIGYTPPESGVSDHFYLGLGIALLATIGWGSEGVLATYGMDLIDPTVALNIYQIVSGVFYLFVMLPLLGGWIVLSSALTSTSGLILVGAAFLGSCSYLLWYRAMNMTGVSRAMAMNITYALWGILFSALLTDVEITRNLIAGAVVITIGMVLVVGNPKEIANLRNVA